PLVTMHPDADTERFRVVHEELAEKSPQAARRIVLTKRKHLRALAGGGFEAIRTVPGFTDAERGEAAALLTFALEPAAATLGLPKRVLRKGALLLDADTVERIAGSLTAAQAEALVDAVLHSRARVKRYRGNAQRARALASLAGRLPERKRAPVVRAAVEELARMAKTGDKRPKRGKKRPKWQGRPMKITDPDGAHGDSVVVFFDDQAVVDEGIDLVFRSYVEDLSDLEVEYAAFAAGVEALANVLPEEAMSEKDFFKLFELAVLPNRDYGWVCIRALSAFEPRLVGELAELRDDVVECSLETFERLPEELRLEHGRRLAPLLDDDRLERAVAEYRLVRDENAQVRAFAALAPRLAGGFTRRQAEQQLERAERLEDGEQKLRALASLAPLVDETTEARAVELALSLDFAAHAMKGVALLSPRLSDGVRTGAVAVAYERGDSTYPDNNFEDAQIAEAWADLLPFLSPDQRNKGMRQAADLVADQALPSDFKRGVRQLGPFLDSTTVSRLEAYQWLIPEELRLLIHSSAGHLLSPADQSELLDKIALLPAEDDRLGCLLELVPQLSAGLKTRGADAAWDIAVSTEDRSFSKVAEWVSKDRLTAALAELDYSTSWAVELVSATAAHVPSDALTMVLARIADEPNRLRFLAGVIEYLDDSSRTEAVRHVTSAPHADQPWPAMSSLMPFVAAPTRREMIAGRLADLMGGSRSEVLALCAEPGIVGPLSDDAVAAIAAEIAEICQDWDWI
ncbi:MAG: hypothetical protein M3P23_03680, partial [Actinomycetota bacterium]|nr:hypothetical protein [Actinomycetota bacterium]